MDYEISIIIPLYNVELNIFKACLDSILSQINENMELIIINDGSKIRDTVIFCKEYINDYKNVRIIDRLENKGVSVTRNEGIELSTGKFIMFVDADDMLELNALKELEQTVKLNPNCDTIFYEYSILKGNEKYACFRKINGDDCKSFNKKMVERMLLGIDFNSPCTILYSKKLIKENNISFDSGLVIGEDYKFNTQYLQFMLNGMYIHESLYVYRMRQGSTTNSFSMKKVEDTGSGYFIGKRFLTKYFYDEYSKNIRDSFYNLYYECLLSHILNGIISGAEEYNIRDMYELKWVKDLINTPDVHINRILRFIINGKRFKVFYILSFIKVFKIKIEKALKKEGEN